MHATAKQYNHKKHRVTKEVPYMSMALELREEQDNERELWNVAWRIMWQSHLL